MVWVMVFDVVWGLVLVMGMEWGMVLGLGWMMGGEGKMAVMVLLGGHWCLVG